MNYERLLKKASYGYKSNTRILAEFAVAFIILTALGGLLALFANFVFSFVIDWPVTWKNWLITWGIMCVIRLVLYRIK